MCAAIFLICSIRPSITRDFLFLLHGFGYKILHYMKNWSYCAPHRSRTQKNPNRPILGQLNWARKKRIWNSNKMLIETCFEHHHHHHVLFSSIPFNNFIDHLFSVYLAMDQHRSMLCLVSQLAVRNAIYCRIPRVFQMEFHLLNGFVDIVIGSLEQSKNLHLPSPSQATSHHQAYLQWWYITIECWYV